jgi:hypothetical protein
MTQTVDSKSHLQLNEYETDPYFLQLSQHMTSDCLFTFVFFPNLPVLHGKLLYYDVQNNFWSKTGKFGGKHKSKQTIAYRILA